MKDLSIVWLISLFVLTEISSTNFALAAEPLEVVINEIAWMGNEVSYNNEWVELSNNTDSSLNLEGWVLKAVDGSPEINLTGQIPANSFYLLERTDDDTLPEILADQIYTGALKNEGESLELYDNFGNLIDSVNCALDWFAGDNKTKQTMERKNPSLPGNDIDNWHSSQNPGGTPKAKNSVTEVAPPEPEPEPKPEPELELKTKPETKPETLTYPSNIVINEILPSPEGSDAEEEWIEIKNLNDFEVDLSGWKIADTIGTPKTYTFPEGSKISAKGFLVLLRPETKITLNNSGDSLNLFQPNDNLIDKVAFGKAPLGQSFNLTETEWIWSTSLTPNSDNIIPSQSVEESLELKAQAEREPKVLPLEIKAPFKALRRKELAAAEAKAPKLFLPYLAASTLAIFSGIIILFLKRKIKKIDFSKKLE